MYLNKAIIIGNLTRDPELRSLPSGMKVASFGIATNRVWKNAQGEKQTDTDFHNIVVFGKQAETTAQYLKKGSSAMIEGRIQNRTWEGKDGQKRYTSEIVAEKVQFGPKPSGGSGGSNYSAPAQTKTADEPKANAGPIEYPQEEINVDDIPF